MGIIDLALGMMINNTEYLVVDVVVVAVVVVVISVVAVVVVFLTFPDMTHTHATCM